MKKDIYFEKIRGIAIIMVILIHTVPTNTELLLCLRQIFNFAVPMFIFLSGYFIDKTKVLNHSKNFVKSRVCRILIPYLFWSLLLIIISQLTSGIDIRAFLYRLITGQALGPYYFIIVLLQLIIITPLMVRIDKHRLGVIALYIITPISLFALYYINLISNTPFSLYSLPFTMWFIFYYYGYRVKQNTQIEQSLSKNITKSLVAYLAFLSLSVAEAVLIYNNYNQVSFAVSQIKITSFLASFALINLVLGIKKYTDQKPNFLSYIGNMSFGIFFIHMIVITLTKQFASKLHLDVGIPLIWTFVGLFGSIVIIAITKKIFKDSILRKYFGF